MEEKEEKPEIDIEKKSSIQTNTPRHQNKNKSYDKKLHRIQEDLHALILALEAKGFDEFIQYLHSPWRIMWSNFLAGIFKGLGILIGMTIVLGLFIWILSKLVDFPLIGQYFEVLLNYIQSIAPPTAY